MIKSLNKFVTNAALPVPLVKGYLKLLPLVTTANYVGDKFTVFCLKDQSSVLKVILKHFKLVALTHGKEKLYRSNR
jgi:hypothetical protein